MEVDHGPVKSYQTFAAGDRTIGGILTKLKGTPFSFWLHYFNVPDMAQALVRWLAAQQTAMGVIRTNAVWGSCQELGKARRRAAQRGGVHSFAIVDP